MPITTGFSDLSNLHRQAFPTQLSLLIATISEVYPAAPATGGSRQQIRVTDTRGGRIDVQMFDQGSALLQNTAGKVIRFSASPTAKRAMVWERSKSVKPEMHVGTLVVRSQAKIETFTPEQALAMGVTAYGFAVAETAGPQGGMAPSAAPLTAPSSPTLPTDTAIQPIAAPSLLSGDDLPESEAVKVAQCFKVCLTAAKKVFGPDARSEEVMATARATFDELMSRRSAA